MTEEFQRGVIPLARYQEQQLPEYQDNPLISALPPIPDLQEVVDLLQQLPGFEPQEALLDGRLRAHAIARLLHGFFQPLSHHLELESKISQGRQHVWITPAGLARLAAAEESIA